MRAREGKMRKRANVRARSKMRKRSKMRASREPRQLELSRSSQLGASEFVSSEACREQRGDRGQCNVRACEVTACEVKRESGCTRRRKARVWCATLWLVRSAAATPHGITGGGRFKLGKRTGRPAVQRWHLVPQRMYARHRYPSHRACLRSLGAAHHRLSM